MSMKRREFLAAGLAWNIGSVITLAQQGGTAPDSGARGGGAVVWAIAVPIPSSISGRNPDYVRSTYDHLIGMHVVDPLLHRIVDSLAQET